MFHRFLNAHFLSLFAYLKSFHRHIVTLISKQWQDRHSQRVFIPRYKWPHSKLHIAITFWYNQSLSFLYTLSRVGAWILLVQILTVPQLELATLIFRSTVELLA